MIDELGEEVGVVSGACLFGIRPGVTLSGKIQRENAVPWSQPTAQVCKVSSPMTNGMQTDENRTASPRIRIRDCSAAEQNHLVRFLSPDSGAVVRVTGLSPTRAKKSRAEQHHEERQHCACNDPHQTSSSQFRSPRETRSFAAL